MNKNTSSVSVSKIREAIEAIQIPSVPEAKFNEYGVAENAVRVPRTGFVKIGPFDVYFEIARFAGKYICGISYNSKDSGGGRGAARGGPYYEDAREAIAVEAEDFAKDIRVRTDAVPAVATATAPSEDDGMADLVREAWARAQQGLRAIVEFGAMLIELEERLGKGRGVNSTSGGLRGWLAENCPEVNYKTAMGYKAAAVGVRNLVRLADDRPLLALMRDEPTEREAETLRDGVFAAIAENSLRVLREAGGAAPSARGGHREGAGRPRLLSPGQDMAGAAIVAWGRCQNPISSFVAHNFAAYLDPAAAKMALDAATALRDAILGRLDEIRAGR